MSPLTLTQRSKVYGVFTLDNKGLVSQRHNKTTGRYTEEKMRQKVPYSFGASTNNYGIPTIHKNPVFWR